jgi:hypothetical protein
MKMVTSSQVTVDKPLSDRSRTVRVTPVGAASRTCAGMTMGALTVNGTYPTMVSGEALARRHLEADSRNAGVTGAGHVGPAHYAAQFDCHARPAVSAGLTDTGLDQLTEWLAEPVRRSAGFRDEFVQKVLAASLRGEDMVRPVCRVQRRALLAEAKALQTLRREREGDPGASFTIEVAILRTNAELECVEAAEARAGQRLIELPSAADLADSGALETADRESPARRRQARPRRQAHARGA